MPYFVKKPIVVFAEEIKEPIDVKTLEGVMRGNKGDMLITGVKGEKYPCKRDIFDATYEPLAGNREAKRHEFNLPHSAGADRIIEKVQ